jgi:hypothetical protein
MEYKGNNWITNSQMTKYHSMLCENPHTQPQVVKTLNPDTLLLVDLGSPEHDCLEVIHEVFLNQPDLTDQPINHPDVEYFTNGSRFIWDSTCSSGYAIVTLDSVIEACPLPVGTSAQNPELVTFTWAL